MVKKPLADAVTPPEVLQAALQSAGDDILIGGQALAYWVDWFGLKLEEDVAVITADIDFLTHSPAARESVNKQAKALNGDVYFPNERALTALVGQAYVVISEDEKYNVDVLWEAYGFAKGEVAARAIEVAMGDVSFRVMHPLHVLRSRLLNLHKIPEKQNDKGAMQLRMSIDVAREWLRERARDVQSEALRSGRTPIQPLISEIERLAAVDAGRKVARRYGVHVADAIDPSLIPAGPFWSKRWPGLQGLMSPGYAALFAAPPEPCEEESPSPGRPPGG